MILRHFLNKRSAIVATIAVFLLSFSLAISCVYALPTVTLTPTSGPQGSTVMISGSGFTPNGQVSVGLWNGTTTSSYTADVNGNLNETVTVPSVATGIYGLNFTDVSNGRTTLVTFNVTQSNLPTNTPSPSSTIPEFPILAVGLVVLMAGSAIGWIAIKKKAYLKI